MQKVWDKLLDNEFVAAYEHGFVVYCTDGQYRRFYPRIFTYSADYPEKSVLLFLYIRHDLRANMLLLSQGPHCHYSRQGFMPLPAMPCP